MTFWTNFYKACLVVLAVIVAIALICIFSPKCNRVNEMQRQKVEDKKEIDGIKEDIKVLKEKQEKFSSDPTFVERTAREELDMIKPNETLYKFTNEQSRAGK